MRLSAWLCLLQVSVKIGGEHVVNSPTTIKLSSTRQHYDNCEVNGDALTQVVKNEVGTFRIRFSDVYGNPTIQQPSFCESFVAGIALTAPGVTNEKKAKNDCVGTWIAGTEQGHSEYQISYTAPAAGNFALHVFIELPSGERHPLPNSPFALSVKGQGEDRVVTTANVDASGQVSGDYKIDRSVFDEVLKRWGECTIDAFASTATALLPRFWTAKNTPGSEGTDAFKQVWKSGERVWAHPPDQLLDKLAKFLKTKERIAEVIVCAPFRPSSAHTPISNTYQSYDALHSAQRDLPCCSQLSGSRPFPRSLMTRGSIWREDLLGLPAMLRNELLSGPSCCFACHRSS